MFTVEQRVQFISEKIDKVELQKQKLLTKMLVELKKAFLNNEITSYEYDSLKSRFYDFR